MLAAGGCSHTSRAYAQSTASSLGISVKAFALIQSEIRKRPDLVVVKYWKSDDGAIHAHLATKSDATSGPSIAFRKRGEQWTADTSLPEIWVVTRQ